MGAARLRIVEACKPAQRHVRASAAPTLSALRSGPVSLLQHWAEENGTQAPNVRVCQLKGSEERGLQATGRIAQGSDIASVPRAIALVVADSDKCPCPDVVDSGFFRKCSRNEKLAILLLHEKSLGSSSRVHTYIEALPQTIDLPFLWTDEDLQLLRNAGFRADIQASKKRAAEQFQALKQSSPNCQFTEEQFNWALSCVLSRGFLGPYTPLSIKDWLNLLLVVTGATAVSLTFGLFPEEQILSAAFASISFSIIYSLLRGGQLKSLTLCPLIDMANYDGSKGAELRYEFFRDCFCVSAGDAFKSGEEVFISYGEQTTDSLMQRFGFVLPESSEDTYIFYDVDLKLKKKCPADRWQQVEEAIASDRMPKLDKIAIDSKARLDDRVLGAMRFLFGVSEQLQEDMQPSTADRPVFEFVLEMALEQPGATKADLKSEQSALKLAKKLESSRAALAHEYNAANFSFLQKRIGQLRRRVEQLQ